MNVGSLFAGIGGFDLGLERAGFEVAWQVELDPWCRGVLARHFPRARRLEDVREVGAGTLAAVDVLCGGFPCQDLSTAGKGAGIDGARSGLWAEFARLVRELRPRYVLVENVPALLTGKGKRWDRAPIGRVLGDLAEAGYDAEWARLSAREFGAPHLRKRIWIVAYPRAGADADPCRLPGLAQLDRGAAPGCAARACRQHPDRLRDALPDPERDRTGHLALPRSGRQGRQPTVAPQPAPLRQEDREGGPENARTRRAELADADRQRRQEREIGGSSARGPSGPGDPLGDGPRQGRGGGPADPWASEPRVGRVADGVPDRVDRLAGLGNALVPQIAEWIGRGILEYEAGPMSAAPTSPPGGGG